MNFTFTMFLNETIDLACDYFHYSDGYRAGAHMKEIYSGPIAADTADQALDRLFEIFNISHPKDYLGRSLSVGDVVALKNEKGTESAYSCEFSGWREISGFDPATKNPDWLDFDEYFAHQDQYERQMKDLRAKPA